MLRQPNDRTGQTNSDRGRGQVMARIRTIKPEFWTDEDIVELSIIARLFFIGMWNFADDHGNLPAAPKSLKMKILPADDADVPAIMIEILSGGFISEYTIDNKKYYHINGFTKHQKINKSVKHKYPPPEHAKNNSQEDLIPEEKEKEKESKYLSSLRSDKTAPAVATPSAEKQKINQEETREFESERDRLWAEGPPALTALGVAEKQARSLIGKWLKDHDPPDILAAIEAAREAKTHDPIPYVTEVLKESSYPDSVSPVLEVSCSFSSVSISALSVRCHKRRIFRKQPIRSAFRFSLRYFSDIYSLQGRNDLAIENYRQVLRIGPKSEEVHLKIAKQRRLNVGGS